MNTPISEKQKNLYQIQNEIYQTLTELEEINEETGEIIPVDESNIYPYLDELANQEMTKIDNIGFAFKRAKADIDYIKEEEKKLAQRRKSIEERNQRFKDYLITIFNAFNLKKIKGSIHTISIHESMYVDIDVDPATLPAEYVTVKTTYSPLKKEIKEAIKNGATIKGATLKERQSLQIR